MVWTLVIVFRVCAEGFSLRVKLPKCFTWFRTLASDTFAGELGITPIDAQLVCVCVHVFCFLAQGFSPNV